MAKNKIPKMMHPESFLLQKIVDSNDSYLKTFPQLQARHIDDIAEVMREFAELTSMNVIERLQNGESVMVNNKMIVPQKCGKKV